MRKMNRILAFVIACSLVMALFCVSLSAEQTSNEVQADKTVEVYSDQNIVSLTFENTFGISIYGFSSDSVGIKKVTVKDTLSNTSEWKNNAIMHPCGTFGNMVQADVTLEIEIDSVEKGTYYITLSEFDILLDNTGMNSDYYASYVIRIDVIDRPVETESTETESTETESTETESTETESTETESTETESTETESTETESTETESTETESTETESAETESTETESTETESTETESTETESTETESTETESAETESTDTDTSDDKDDDEDDDDNLWLMLIILIILLLGGGGVGIYFLMKKLRTADTTPLVDYDISADDGETQWPESSNVKTASRGKKGKKNSSKRGNGKHKDHKRRSRNRQRRKRKS